MLYAVTITRRHQERLPGSWPAVESPSSEEIHDQICEPRHQHRDQPTDHAPPHSQCFAIKQFVAIKQLVAIKQFVAIKQPCPSQAGEQ